MASVRWTVGARRDLQSIVQFIASDSPTYAAATADQILTAVERLRRFPKLGRIVPEYNQQDLRELIIGNFRVVYRLRRGNVGVVAVVHGNRELLRRIPREKWDLA